MWVQPCLTNITNSFFSALSRIFRADFLHWAQIFVVFLVVNELGQLTILKILYFRWDLAASFQLKHPYLTLFKVLGSPINTISTNVVLTNVIFILWMCNWKNSCLLIWLEQSHLRKFYVAQFLQSTRVFVIWRLCLPYSHGYPNNPDQSLKL